MRLRLIVPKENSSSLIEKLDAWNVYIVSKDESGNQLSLVCEMETSLFRDCNAFVRSLYGRSEVLAASVHFEKDTDVDHYDEHKAEPNTAEFDEIDLNHRLQKHTCNAFVGDAKQYREHFKSEWHRHNLRRKTRQLPPLTADECLEDLDLGDVKSDLKEYTF
ncbi:hypothetical protein MKW94_022768 [Papaver nudicaule]|uniref:Ribosome maturation protein SDO1/SBDS C-terminal domain-containing protein n=1 Tax=Papaver nudicaule TaxID=74823 RepID=A0AA41SIZ2_PAPNU|nr:hypothetical protein [Papaver nudicaule]